jgi:hypothetical protein
MSPFEVRPDPGAFFLINGSGRPIDAILTRAKTNRLRERFDRSQSIRPMQVGAERLT